MNSRSDASDPGSPPEPIGTDVIVPVLACILAVYYLATTTDLVWEARAAGVFIGVPLLVMCIVHLARMGLRVWSGHATLGTGTLFADNLFNRQRLGLLIVTALFIATIEWVGTTLGIFLLLLASMLMLGVRRIPVLIGISVITSSLVYVLLIQLLSSRLPQGPVEWLLNPIMAKLISLVTGGG